MIVKRALAVGVAAAAVSLLGALPAHAAASASDFGQHVRMCAQMMGFDGEMNPGMHQGKSGWDPHHDCHMH